MKEGGAEDEGKGEGAESQDTPASGDAEDSPDLQQNSMIEHLSYEAELAKQYPQASTEEQLAQNQAANAKAPPLQAQTGVPLSHPLKVEPTQMELQQQQEMLEQQYWPNQPIEHP